MVTKKQVEELLGKMSWEGSILDLAESRPQMFEDIGLGDDARKAVKAICNLESKVYTLAEQHGIDVDEYI